MASQEKITTMFLFKNIDAAMEFYERRDKLGLKGEEACRLLLMEMAREGKIDRVSETKRTPEQIVKDYSKHGFKIQDKRWAAMPLLTRIWLRIKSFFRGK